MFCPKKKNSALSAPACPEVCSTCQNRTTQNKCLVLLHVFSKKKILLSAEIRFLHCLLELAPKYGNMSEETNTKGIFSAMTCFVIFCLFISIVCSKEVSQLTVPACRKIYGIVVSRIDKIIGLFCKRALYKRRYTANETCNFIRIH